MSGNEINRRDFLKIMGWSGVGAALAGCDMPTTVTLEEGKETVVSYLSPEEYVIPGVGVWYASTCQQCGAGCGIQGRVREGRLLKLEGNPESPVNYGKLCQMGQAGLQGHYNPDRLQKPKIRKNGQLVDASWEEAMQLLQQKTNGVAAGRFAWFTGTVSGHQAVLMNAYAEALGSAQNHFVHEVVNNAVARAVNQEVLGDPDPVYLVDKAQVVLSFGADLVGASPSPVWYATEYAKFREAPRGVLVQVEPNMTLTGANADMWVAARPGTEGVLALGIANTLINRNHVDAGQLPAEARDLIAKYDANKVAQVTGVAGDRIVKIAKWLNDRRPSLVVTGASADAQSHGYETAAAAMMLNVLLGNVGKTIVSSGSSSYPQLASKAGDTASLLKFAQAVEQKSFDVVFFYNANPVYTAPKFLKLGEKLQGVPFKVAFAHYPDETTMAADLVLPLYSAYEDWGTHIPRVQTQRPVLSLQQPLMEPLYAETRGFGDVMLALLKTRDAAGYGAYNDYYSYLREAFKALPAGVKGDAASDEIFWQRVAQRGVLEMPATAGALSAKPVSVGVPEPQENSQYPFHLVPTARLGLWDGRHANLPWLQEAPDQITKIVWDSWAEIHPSTAAKLGVKKGDYLTITSDQGSMDVRVFIYNGIHPEAIAVPLGQGHEEYGRYAKGRGVNPLKILSPVTDAKTGELALHGTRVKLAKANKHKPLVAMGGSDTQVGRKMVATVTADAFRRTEGSA